MNDIAWSAPNTIPAGMSETVYRSILNRNDPHNPPCERFASGECQCVCQPESEDGSRKLNFSHRHADSLGGYADTDNIFLECEIENKKRGAAPDLRFNMPSPFDESFDYSKLRCSQTRVIDEVDSVRPLWTQHRDKLRELCLLIVATTGAGKGIAIVSALHRISEIVLRDASSGYRRRPTNVIWFAPERSLATALMNELKTEPVKYKMRETELQTYDAGEGSFNLNRALPRPGIVFACPQFFWKVDNRTRSDADVAQILSHYDTIIWDECDFAEEQLARLCTLAPHALKFGLTATPINGSGQFLRRFVVGPVIDYETVHDQDHCLKIFERGDDDGISPNIILSSTGHHREARGNDETDRDGCSNDNESLRGNIATIRRSILDADEIETRMRSVDKKGYYSPHIIIRAGSVAQAEDLFLQVFNMLPNMQLMNEGWGVCLMHGRLKDYPYGNGARMKVPENEKRLGNTQKHPWFLAKHNGGKSTKQSKRVLIVVDMGIRGLNNWPCLSAVDLTNTTSMVELIQFLMTGRIGRWLDTKKKWLVEKKYKEFVSARIYLQKDSDQEKVNAIEKALSFQLDMVELIGSSNIRTWQSLVYEDVVSDAVIDITPPDNPFSGDDKLQIDVLLNAYCENNDCESDSIDEGSMEIILDNLPPVMSGLRLERAKKYINEIAHDPIKREERKHYREEIPNPLPVVIYESPKEPGQYTINELSEWGSVHYNHESSVLQKCMEQNNILMDIIAKSKNRDDKRLYVAPVATTPLQGKGGLIPRIAGQYANDWIRRGVIKEEDRFTVNKAINVACKQVFGLDDATNESRLNTPEFQHKLLGIEATRRIKQRVESILIKWNVINVGRLYGE